MPDGLDAEVQPDAVEREALQVLREVVEDTQSPHLWTAAHLPMTRCGVIVKDMCSLSQPTSSSSRPMRSGAGRPVLAVAMHGLSIEHDSLLFPKVFLRTAGLLLRVV